MLVKMGGGMLLKNQAIKWGNGLEKLQERNMKPVNLMRPIMVSILIGFLLPHMIKALHQ